MEPKKRDTNFTAAIIAIIALVGLAFYYHYLGEYAITKVDAALGISHDYQITDLVIEKGYNTDSGLKVPEIIISYKTTRDVASYIDIEGKKSEMNIGSEFTKKIILSRDYFGKSVDIEIVARDELGKEVVVDRTVTLPENIEPAIAVINT